MSLDLMQMFTGIVPDANNTALTYLANIFNHEIVFGAGSSGGAVDNASVYMVVLGTLSVMYIAISLMILVFLFVQKTYLTARDKEYLGRDDKNKLFGLLLVFVIMMLTPVPGYNGISLVQYISIKMFKGGSNLADWTAYKFLTVSAMTNNNTTTSELGKESNIRYYAFKRFMDAAPKFQCASLLSANNILGLKNEKGQYLNGLTEAGAYTAYKQLRDVCAIPYKTIENNFGKLKDIMGPTYYASISKYNTTSGSVAEDNGYLQELSCYETEYAKLLALGYVVIDNNNAKVVLSPKFTVAKDDKTPWINLATNATQCLLDKKVIQIAGNGEYIKYSDFASNGSLASQIKESERGGWVTLGDVFDDSRQGSSPLTWTTTVGKISLLSYDKEQNEDPFALPNADKFPSARFTGQYTSLNTEFQQVRNNVIKNAWLDWNPDNGAGSGEGGNAALAAAKDLGAMVVFASFLDTATAALTGNPLTLTDKILSSNFTVAENRNQGRKAMARLKAIKSIASNMISMKKESDKVIKEGDKAGLILSLTKKIPGIQMLSMAVSSVNGVLGVIGEALNTPLGTVLIALLTFLNLLDVLPKVLLGYVLFVWLFQCAAFVFTAPLGLTISLLPNTRVGHDTWKSGLALMMKPFLHVIFFILSIHAVDLALQFSWAMMMSNYGMDNGILKGLWTIATELLNGEMLLRLIGCFGLYTAITVYSLAFIVNGPNQVFKIIGLNPYGVGESDEISRKIGKYTGDNASLRLNADIR